MRLDDKIDDRFKKFRVIQKRADVNGAEGKANFDAGKQCRP
jgi:hypothetical protein